MSKRNVSRKLINTILCSLIWIVATELWITPNSIFALDEASHVRAVEQRGHLPHQFDVHYLQLEPNYRNATVSLTLAYESDGSGTLEKSVNFLVMTQSGLQQFLTGVDPADVAIAIGTPIPFDVAGNKRRAVFQASDPVRYTVVVYNTSDLPVEYTLSAQGGLLLGDEEKMMPAEESTFQVESLGGSVTAPEVEPGAELPYGEKKLGDEPPVVGVRKQIRPVRARKLSGTLDKRFDRHYLTLLPNSRTGDITLDLAIESLDGEELDGLVNFWVLTEDGMRHVVHGALATELNLATGFPVQNVDETNLFRAAFRVAGRGPYTVIMFNSSNFSAKYTLAVDGALLVDQYGQTNESRAAAMEIDAVARLGVSLE